MEGQIAAVIATKPAEWDREERETSAEGRKYKYELLPSAHHNEELNDSESSDPELEADMALDTFRRKHSNLEAHLRSFRKSSRGRIITMAFGVVGILLFLYWAIMYASAPFWFHHLLIFE